MSTNLLSPAGRAFRANRQTQRGVVLFISLIVLVAMGLAGIALLRSGDTTVMVSGNIALKQSAILGADQGTQAAVTWLEANIGGTTLQSNNTGAGYYSNLILPDPDWFADATWAAAFPVNGGAADVAGNKMSYLIHRQCTLTDLGYDQGANACAAIDESVGGSVLTEGDSFRAGIGNVFARPKKVYYRITTRVQGPRNSVSIVQTTVALQA
jgi:type IV pilus assembly protein PilX